MRKNPTVAVVIHMFYPNMAEEILGYIENIPFPADVFISTDNLEIIAERLEGVKGRAEVRIIESRGLDIASRHHGRLTTLALAGNPQRPRSSYITPWDMIRRTPAMPPVPAVLRPLATSMGAIGNVNRLQPAAMRPRLGERVKSTRSG